MVAALGPSSPSHQVSLPARKSRAVLGLASARMSSTGERILVVTAHPDDVDFGAGGSVATWTDAGATVTYCVATDGDAGGFDPAIPRSEIPSIRRAEQTAAAAVLGVHDLYWLGYPDGRVTVSLDLRRDISRVIRQVRPDRVVCQSPDRNWERLFASHPDHLAVGEATICAVYPDARNPFTFTELIDDEGLEAFTVPELWVMGGGGRNDTWIDVGDTFARKLAALRCHASQLKDPGDPFEERLRGMLAANGTTAGWTDGRLAEGFSRFVTG
jgi:LmbE family N-acetylglucosaminyl deacetylase